MNLGARNVTIITFIENRIFNTSKHFILKVYFIALANASTTTKSFLNGRESNYRPLTTEHDLSYFKPSGIIPKHQAIRAVSARG